MKVENNKKSEEDQWMFCLPNKMLKNDIKIFTITHPGTDMDGKFVYDATEKELFEIKQHKDKYSSWLIDESVKCDGSLYVVTPFDPVFILISCLQATDSKKYILLDQMFSQQKHNSGEFILACLEGYQLSSVCDVSGSGEYTGYKFSQDKALKWLKCKVVNTYNALKIQNIFISGSENKRQDGFEENVLHYACGLVGDCIPNSLNVKLHEYLNLALKTEKRKSSAAAGEPKSKKSKCNEDYSNLLPKGEKPKPKLTKKQKELSKVDKRGMKNISAFFSPKAKK